MDKYNEKPDSETELSAVVEGYTTTEEAPEECFITPPTDPCTLVIIGASGDLTSRKLVPALYHLFQKEGLPEHFQVVGCGRTELSDEKFRERMAVFLPDGEKTQAQWKQFRKKLSYRVLQYDSLDSYRSLGKYLEEIDSKVETRGNRIFYLALPMFLYGTTAKLLGESGLAAEYENGNGWTRLVVEKPYGSDRESARELDRTVHEHFEERRVYRIDHYLTKETVQNILIFRFANAIFEPMWNRNYIEHVDILASETLGVEKRASYYEKSGVLRDMFQNHMLQLLALTAMEPPTNFDSQAVHDEKVRVFRNLKPFPVEDLFANLVLGQYGSGVVNGKALKGYREEAGVDKNSLVPTYGMMRAYIETWRWHGIPFFITSGKRLGAKLTEIVIKFKEVPVSMFREVLGEHILANVLTIGIQPNEHITLSFQAKTPGAETCLRTVNMDFDFGKGRKGPELEAYEKALLDCMEGDQMLFWRQDGIDQAWTYIEPILNACEECTSPERLLHIYPAGSWGPEAAVQLKELMVDQCR